MTLIELQERLYKEEETILLELLDITSEEIADRFVDKIEDKYEQLVLEYEENSIE